ncbi:MAG: fibronectin type III domain-containing protein [Thermoplasmata archaeon]
MKASRLLALILIWVMVSTIFPHSLTRNAEGTYTLVATWNYPTNSTVAGISITDDGTYIGAYDTSNNVYLFNAESGTLLRSWVHPAAITGIKIAKMADPPLLFVSDAHAIRVYRQDMQSPYRIYSPNQPYQYGWNTSLPAPGNISGFDISADGKLLMVTFWYMWNNNWKYNVSVYNVESGKELWSIQTGFPNAKGNHLSACYDGKFFVVGVSESDSYIRLELYDKDNPYGYVMQTDRLKDLAGSGFLSTISALKMSDDGTGIIVCTNNAVLKFIQTQNAEVWRVDKLKNAVAVSMNYTGSEGFVAVDTQIIFMDFNTTNSSKRFKWNWTTPDGNKIVNAIMDKEGQYIVVATAKNMWIIYGPSHKRFAQVELSTDFELVRSLDLSRNDGMRIALGAAYRVTDNPAGVYMFLNPGAKNPDKCQVFVTSVTTTTINVSWSQTTAADFEQYEIYYDKDFRVISTTPEKARSYKIITERTKNYEILTGLEPGTKYYIRVRVVCITGLYSDSDVVEKMTDVPPPPPDYTPYIVAAVVTTVLVLFLLWYFYLRHKIPEWKEKRKKKKGKGVAWHQRPGEYLPPGFE